MAYIISDPFSDAGHWWVPEAQETVVHGTTVWDSKRAKTELNSLFEVRLPLAGFPGRTSYPVLHGTSRDGKKLTLLESEITHIHTNFGDDFRQHAQMESAFLIVGDHVDSDTRYQSAEFSVPGIHVWLARPTVTSERSGRNESGGMRIDYSVEAPKSELVRIHSLATEIIFQIRMTQASSEWKVDVDTTGVIRFVPDEPQSLAWYRTQAIRLTMLISFMSASPMMPNSVRLFSLNGEKLNALTTFDNSGYCGHSSKNDYFMLRDCIGSDFDETLNRWFGVNEQLSVASKLAAGVLCAESLSPSVELLLLLQSLESLHRGMSPGLYMDSKKFDDVANALIRAIPSDSVADNHRASIKSRIRFANQMSLRNRLKELEKGLGEPIVSMVLGPRPKVLDSWTDTRNYFTHWDQETKENVLEDADLLRAIVKIRNFLRVLYLDLVGVPRSAIVQSLENGSIASQHLIRILNSEFTIDAQKNNNK